MTIFLSIYYIIIGFIIAKINWKRLYYKFKNYEMHNAIFITKDADVKAVVRFYVNKTQNKFKWQGNIYTFDNTKSKKWHFYFVDSSDEIERFNINDKQKKIVETVHNVEIVKSLVSNETYKKLLDVKKKYNFDWKILLIVGVIIYILILILLPHNNVNDQTVQTVVQNVSQQQPIIIPGGGT